jgi:hypothetical protein
MTSSRLALIVPFVFVSMAAAEELTAAAIMSRVAGNQERSVEARQRWTHHQEVFVRLTRSNGKLAREEIKQYAVTPTATSVKKELVGFEGRYQDGGKTVAYDKPGFERKDMDIDADLVDDFPDDMVSDGRSRDGIDRDLFPLTREQQAKYTFKLLGREQYRGQDVYRVGFEPPKGEYAWAGEALIDAAEFQPLLVTTRFSRKLPMLVRTALGTDIQHLGFRVEYRKLEDGVWFPSKYSGEFNLRAVFFYKRKIAVSMRNDDFRKADVRSTIEYAGIEEQSGR